MMTTRERLHAILDELPDDMLDAVEAAIVDLTEPPYRPLSEAPADDEPLTEEDLEAIREGRAEHARGEYVTNDELKRRMGW